jgi:hypothetical protein
MSSMLEQAIVDAEALRETAINSAEAQIIEKYSDQVKEAVEQLLEQDFEGGDITQKMPLAATDDESLCPCPDTNQEGEPEEIEIDFKELAERMKQEEATYGEMMDREETAEKLEEEEEIVEEEEEVDLQEQDLEEIVEELTVDIKPQKSGWLGTPDSQMEQHEDEIVANLQGTKEKEEHEALKKAVGELEEAKQSTQKALLENKKYTEKLENVIYKLKEKLEEVNLSNARLLFTNKALASDSLNERQKTQIAEALSKAESVEEAKVIYETLQSTVGVAKRKQPESLSEAVSRSKTSSAKLFRKKPEQKQNPVSDRWKLLAGIKDN